MERLPTVFLSHGSPLHALEAGGAGPAWRGLAASLPRPRAILIASAHWETQLPMLTGGERLATIHDFSGFPPGLYRLRYDVAGSPTLAARAAALLKAADVAATVNACRGIDHGAWVPLRWMYPAADVPLVQLSVQTALGSAHHLHVGDALAPLREEGVLVIGSGHMTHNLRDLAGHRDGPEPADYVVQFSQWAAERLARDDCEALLAWRDQAPAAARAHPTDEHFLPLFIALGAAGPAARATRVYSGIDAGVLSMDAYRFD
ncbi:MAG TPA: class III extradiol ring-cleavage dioxygenase [Steroidobacteraceae bacterium]|nr:class III extradiol ring-cleavage dioxygenase [Steroidobacteraceae bacterium]HQX47418.1 class III extradiol ring-cleavage dioxygenase [Steroidobacteraceae bacterium]HQX79239.1 class III extradiol ring-cleavage dioxygenase [Steroidobacteraceae bacterium]